MEERIANSHPVDVLAEKLRGGMVVSVRKEVWETAEEGYKWAVVMKMASRKSYKFGEMASILKKAWGAEDASLSEIANNLWVVKFSEEEEMNRALWEGPWSYRGSTILMEKWFSGCDPEKLKFRKLNVMVQIHNIPFVLRKSEVPKGIAGLVGRVCGESMG